MARRGAAEDLDRLLELDARRRELLPQVEELRARQNTASDAIAEAKRSGGDAEALIAEMKEVSAEAKRLGGELTEVEAARDELAATLPNLPHPDAPDGGEDDAVTLREVGERPSSASRCSTTSSSPSHTGGSTWRRPPRPQGRGSRT